MDAKDKIKEEVVSKVNELMTLYAVEIPVFEGSMSDTHRIIYDAVHVKEMLDKCFDITYDKLTKPTPPPIEIHGEGYVPDNG